MAEVDRLSAELEAVRKDRNMLWNELAQGQNTRLRLVSQRDEALKDTDKLVERVTKLTTELEESKNIIYLLVDVIGKLIKTGGDR